MVEKAYPALKSKKYCHPSHSSQIEFLCTYDSTLCCTKCAAKHAKHFEKVEDIKSIFEVKLIEYRKLKSKLKILGVMQNSPDEIRSYIAHLLETSFDKLLAKVHEAKNMWIEQHFPVLMESLGVDFDDITPDLDNLSKQVEEAFRKIQNFINSDDVSTEEVMKLKQPEEFDPVITQILKDSTKRNKYTDIKVVLDFHPEVLNTMLKIEGYSPYNYSGTLATYSDISFLEKQLPGQVRELKLIYSAKKEGMSASTFHSKCNGIEDTLVIMKGNGHLFGGFAKPQWNSSGGYIPDPTNSSFLFTCRTQTRHKLTNKNCALYGHGGHGPTFGGHAIFVDSSGMKGYTYLGNAYSLPEGSKRETYLSGTNTNNTTSVLYEDYEVHQVVFQ